MIIMHTFAQVQVLHTACASFERTPPAERYFRQSNTKTCQPGIYHHFTIHRNVEGHLSEPLKPLTSLCYGGRRNYRGNDFAFPVILEQPPQGFEL